MTQFVTVDRATLEQMVAALNEVDQHIDLKRYDTAPNEVLFDVVMAALKAGRAALANEGAKSAPQPAQELAKIMKDFADKDPKSLMLKELEADIECKSDAVPEILLGFLKECG